MSQSLEFESEFVRGQIFFRSTSKTNNIINNETNFFFIRLARTNLFLEEFKLHVFRV